VAIVAIAVTLGLAVLIASFVLYAVATGNAHDSRSLDDGSIRAAAASGCVTVTQALNETGADRIQRIDVGNAAILQLVSTMEALGASTLKDDPPATEWIEDWRRLTKARTEFATILSDGKAHPFPIPLTDDGYPITIRMTDVAPVECERAVELAAQP
jgi:hypothetical protein